MTMFIIPYINIEKIESLLNEFSWEMIFQQYKHRSGGGLKHRIVSQKVRSLKNEDYRNKQKQSLT